MYHNYLARGKDDNGINPETVIELGVLSMIYSQTLEAIAKGVETRLLRTIIVNIVTLETIRIARKMHIPEGEIQEWRSLRCYKSKSR
jgi:hypothetical protein